MKVGVIGAGAWGTALAITAARGGADTILWSFDGLYKEFDGVKMPNNLRITRNMADLSSSDTWLAVTPSAFFRETMRRAREFYRAQPIIICTKGAESTTGHFMSEIVRTEMPECASLGVLSGPQFAGEVACGIPTGSTLAGDAIAIKAGQGALNKLYLAPCDDIIGTEICGVGKNAVALICGYNSVAAGGENERALKLTCAWNEVVKIGCALGAKTETFLGLCGLGDLFLSATSVTSRNFAGGIAIARGDAPAGTVEGIYALNGLLHRAEKLGIQTHILREMKEKLKV